MVPKLNRIFIYHVVSIFLPVIAIFRFKKNTKGNFINFICDSVKDNEIKFLVNALLEFFLLVF